MLIRGDLFNFLLRCPAKLKVAANIGLTPEKPNEQITTDFATNDAKKCSKARSYLKTLHVTNKSNKH